MGAVASRELRNNTRAVLDRVEAGEDVVIIVDGRAVARLVALDRHPRFWTRDEFVRDVLARPADRGLDDELRELLPDSTDDLD